MVLPTSMPQILAPLASGNISRGVLISIMPAPHQGRDLDEISFSHGSTSLLRLAGLVRPSSSRTMQRVIPAKRNLDFASKQGSSHSPDRT